MSAFPGSPRVLKGGIAQLDPVSFAVLPNGIIVMQYNPDTVTRTLKVKGTEEGVDRSEAQCLMGQDLETIKLDVEIDAIAPQLAAPEDDWVARRLTPATRRAAVTGLIAHQRLVAACVGRWALGKSAVPSGVPALAARLDRTHGDPSQDDLADQALNTIVVLSAGSLHFETAVAAIRRAATSQHAKAAESASHWLSLHGGKA